jgi:hypothetical protein
MPATVTQQQPAHAPAFLDADRARRNPAPKGRHPKFLFAHKRDAYEVSSGKIVPVLSRYPVMGGLNGTRQIEGRDGKVVGLDHKLLKANLDSWSKQIIPHDVDGEGTSYMVCPFPGKYTDRWTTLYAGSARTSFDQEAYDEWRETLVKNKVTEAPRLPALEQLQRRLITQREGLIRAINRLPAELQGETQASLKQIETNLAVVEKAIKKAPKPKATPLPKGAPEKL